MNIVYYHVLIIHLSLDRILRAWIESCRRYISRAISLAYRPLCRCIIYIYIYIYMQHAHTYSHANRTCGHVHTRITHHKGSYCIHASTYTACPSKGNRSIAEMLNIDHFTRSTWLFDGSLIVNGSTRHLGMRPVLSNLS